MKAYSYSEKDMIQLFKSKLKVDREPTWKKAEDAVQAIESERTVMSSEEVSGYSAKSNLNASMVGADTVLAGFKVFVHGCAATPNYLLEHLANHGKKAGLKDVQLIHIPTVGPALYNNPEYEAQVNKQMPRTLGDSLIHMSHIDCMVENDAPLPEIAPMIRTPEINEIARLIADNLVEDGATLQTGIGNLPDAVLHKLYNHKDLGFHSEMISDTVVNLVEKGALTNAKKNIQTGKIVCSFAMGTKKLYSFLDDNCFVAFHECDFTNNISLISQNPRVTAINTCLEIDLTGQVCSDSIGTKMYSAYKANVL
ncbi:CAT2-like protein [Mya arenaria]|uniref:CAT2-like protein n=1 Tax=Mya arenaria TaxID=6604 RepID=A0ABY7EWU5_MYAAR|nr:CAT2-like protein [Mya arenaria]